MWTFRGEPFNIEDWPGYQGFVYIITNLETGRKYIGRKYLYSIRKKKGKTRRVRSESDWEKYYGSSDLLKEDIEREGEDNFRREILVLCKTRGDCNRMETYYLWKNNVLENDEFYNDSIGNMRAAPKHIIEAREYDLTGR